MRLFDHILPAMLPCGQDAGLALAPPADRLTAEAGNEIAVPVTGDDPHVKLCGSAAGPLIPGRLHFLL